jgi:hypothetical protein
VGRGVTRPSLGPQRYPALIICSRLASALIVAISFIACTPPGGTIVEETHPRITLIGQFGAESSDCPWLDDASGARTYLQLGSSLTVRLRPTRLVNENGSVVATVGDWIQVSGIKPSGGASICSTEVPFPVDLLIPISAPSSGLSPNLPPPQSS